MNHGKMGMLFNCTLIAHQCELEGFCCFSFNPGICLLEIIKIFSLQLMFNKNNSIDMADKTLSFYFALFNPQSLAKFFLLFVYAA